MVKSAKDRDEYDRSLAEDLNVLAAEFVNKAKVLALSRGLRVSYRIHSDQSYGHFLEVRRDLKNKSILVLQERGMKPHDNATKGSDTA